MVLMGENKAALGVVRALGKRGIQVFVGGNQLLSRALYSKYCKGGFIYSHYRLGIEKMHKEILKNVKKFKPEVLFPIWEDTTHVVLKHIDEYEKYCKVSPSIGFKRFKLFNNKESTYKEAMRVGCPIPKTYFPKSIDEVKKLSSKISYPVLIKPRVSSFGCGIVKVFSANELLKMYKYISNKKKGFCFDFENPIIQEFVLGEKHTVTVIFNKGKEIGSTVFKNYRYYPVFGNPLLNETVINEKVRVPIVNLFKKLNWNGPASVQCIIDSKDQRTKLFEINPRIWSHIESTIAAGIDVPYLLYNMALGNKVNKITKYKVNQKFRYVLFGELFYLLTVKKKLSLLRDYLRFKNTKTEIDFRDIKPHLIHFLGLIIKKQKM